MQILKIMWGSNGKMRFTIFYVLIWTGSISKNFYTTNEKLNFFIEENEYTPDDISRQNFNNDSLNRETDIS